MDVLGSRSFIVCTVIVDGKETLKKRKKKKTKEDEEADWTKAILRCA